MEGFIIAAEVVAWFALLIFCFDKAGISNYPSSLMLIGVVLVVLGLVL